MMKLNRNGWLLAIALLIFSGAKAQEAEEARLLRFPAVHGNQVVFSYAGNLYTVDLNGGVARRMTNSAGYEIFPKFSHDGKQIAFTGQYDGNTEVYIMPAEGGVPKRITYTATLGRDDVSDRMGPNNIVMAWSHDDQQVVYRSRKNSFNAFKGQLFSAPVSGDVSWPLRFSVGSWCSWNEDGSLFAHNRVFREFRTWKYYQGGMADEIWLYDQKRETTEQITDNPAQDIMPMMWKNKIYFISDRDRTMNLFEYDMQTKATKKVTNFTEYDIKFPSLGKDAIAFENGGHIYVYDLNSGTQKKVSVIIKEDFQRDRDQQVDASKNVYGWDIAPDGKRMVFCGRGDIFTVPAKEGVTRNLTNSSGAHDRNPTWSPDGKNIAFISDRSGEDELYIQAQDGSSEAKALTSGGGAYKYGATWSPDSKKLLYSDRMMDLWLVSVESGKKTKVFHNESWEIRDFEFSPDSKWIAFTESRARTKNIIWLYQVETGKMVQVTEGWFEANSPRFSPDGLYLYFVSMRDFNPIYSATEWNHVYADMSRIYMVRLSASTPSPFETESDEVMATDPEAAEGNTVNVDADGISDRIEQMPVGNGNYWGLGPVKGGVYYVTSGLGKGAKLKFYDLSAKKEKEIGEYGSYAISHDYKKMVVRKNGGYYIENLPKGKLDPKNKVSMDGMKIMVNKSEEWNQIFNESWRQMRDFFYDPGMHGVDWNAMKTKYGALLPYVNHRNDLTYIIGELIGELSVGHAYVNGGDRPKVDRVKMGLLGAQLSRDESGFYKVDRVLTGQNWNKSLRSPLNVPGVDVKAGNFIVAVNGKSTKDMTNIYESLVGMAGKQVELTVNTKATASNARTVLVVPIADESQLYYFDWVNDNVRKVDELSGGKIGYVHVPNMVGPGLNQFARYFYPQLDKKALIIDDRGNGGGNVSPMIIERLRREVSMYQVGRNIAKGNSKPGQMVIGPKVCLIDQYSASDGDLFPYQFRHYKIGKLIGQRSWGGVVGIRGSLPFVDGGDMRKPEFAHYSADGSKWIIEGYGVDPDIEVVNDPHEEFKGNDIQLKAAIDHLLKELETQEQDIPPHPDFPKKNE